MTAVRAGRRRLRGGDRSGRPGACRCVVLAAGRATCRAARASPPRCPTCVEQVNPLEYRSPGSASRRRRARRRRRGHRRAARRGDPRVRPTGDLVGGRARPRCRARTGVATSSTGWRRSGGSTSATTRSRRSCKARSVASPQLDRHTRASDARPEPAQDAGVELRGRLGGIRDGVALFSGGLRNHCALADQKLGRLLDDDRRLDRGARTRSRRRCRRALRADPGRARGSR